MTSASIQRSDSQMAPPRVLERAYDDPDRVLELIRRGAPYKSITAVQKEPEGTPCAPWFRNFWALGGKVIFDGVEPVFNNCNFIEAAKENFGAKVVKPLAMMTNLNAPAPAAGPHLDLPFFRGAHKREVPSWLLAPMGYSGLFQHWAVPVASAISWFYTGAGGAFEYWPDGPDRPSQRVEGLSANQAVVADNEYMYHRVDAIGEPRQYLPGNQVPYEAMLALDGDTWVIRAGDETLAAYAFGDMRLSVLWKAYCFADEAEERAFNDGSDNLTPRMIVELFCKDMARRGLRVEMPDDLDGHSPWANAVIETYRPAMS
ncbi:MAG: hypothetical protein R3228_16725 [Halioglobus sp.]|nr:hypothetical protein [Halioglobus sp.]